ncbi:MAG: tRNA preQ1(34) S-adenosylmethionine ribosyltransferase-isomerase QueA [Planctomycetota bacterium]
MPWPFQDPPRTLARAGSAPGPPVAGAGRPLRLEDLDYPLPQELIAQEPAPERSASRLLVYRRSGGRVEHARTRDLPALLPSPALLVLNNTRVRRARLSARRRTGGRIDLLVLGVSGGERLHALARPARRLREGEALHVQGAGEVRVVACRGAGRVTLEPVRGARVLLEHGRMPLPHYIRRDPDHDPRDALDLERYQTVFAREEGAVASPTAGLHFTEELFAELRERGHEVVFITLHVGPGTFTPVREPVVSHHTMHAEAFEIPSSTAEAYSRARSAGRPVLAVGTTSLRALETAWDGHTLRPGRGVTDLFIFPPYQVKSAHFLMTNFHLPRSTLLALVAAVIGLEELRDLYRLAIAERYRFYSYGDAMLIL